MPKKQPKNAFFFFMLEFKRTEENRGMRFPNGLAGVSAAASDKWNKMTPQQRGIYDKQAKDAKVTGNRDNNNYTSQGISFAALDQANANKDRTATEMRTEIEQLVQNAFLDNSISSQPFYFVAANYFCKVTTDNSYIPAEIAILQYTLGDGCTRKLHSFVNPGRLPIGYAHEAQERCKLGHGLKPPPSALGDSDLGRLGAQIVEFVGRGKDGRLPPLFTDQKNVESVRSVCAQLAEAAGNAGAIGEAEVSQMRVYPLVKLFYALHTESAKYSATESTEKFPSEHIAQAMLDRDQNDHNDEIACAVHEEMDRARHCAMSVVKRYAFTLSDHLCLDMGIELKPGAHVPRDADVAGAQRIKEERDGKAVERKMKIEKREEKMMRWPEGRNVEPESDEENDEEEREKWNVAGAGRKHMKRVKREGRY